VAPSNGQVYRMYLVDQAGMVSIGEVLPHEMVPVLDPTPAEAAALLMLLLDAVPLAS
jgi:hypothetical protein